MATDSQLLGSRFYIFGQGISFSMSPVIHQAAFDHHNLPYTYEILQTETIDQLRTKIESSEFRGASVTMPHKLDIGKFCDSLTADAEFIGAVNTLIVHTDPVTRKRSVIGDNTDWSGLLQCIKTKSDGWKPKIGLVIGAGGASRAALYALHKAGVEIIYLFNRNQARADLIAQEFKSRFYIQCIDNLAEIAFTSAPDIIIGTIPADKTTVDYVPQPLFARKTGICIDMAYKPRMTPLLIKAKRHEGWNTVTGIEVLLEQAFLQSELWLKLPAPKEVMIDALTKSDNAR